MKKVRKEDLEELILLYYQFFIEEIPDYEFERTITVNINSIYICVIDHRDFDDEEEKKKVMRDFDKELKKITFGNMRVACMGAKKDDDGCFSWMYIANAYEVEIKDEKDKDDRSGF